MKNRLKKRLDWALEKLGDVAIGAYGLATGEKWLQAANGELSIPQAAMLCLASLFLLVAWTIIGTLKGFLENDHESD